MKRVILPSGDTDTTACVTGGLTGILLGFDNIPERWYRTLRRKEKVDALIQCMLGNKELFAWTDGNVTGVYHCSGEECMFYEVIL